MKGNNEKRQNQKTINLKKRFSVMFKVLCLTISSRVDWISLRLYETVVGKYSSLPKFEIRYANMQSRERMREKEREREWDQVLPLKRMKCLYYFQDDKKSIKTGVGVSRCKCHKVPHICKRNSLRCNKQKHEREILTWELLRIKTARETCIQIFSHRWKKWVWRPLRYDMIVRED